MATEIDFGNVQLTETDVVIIYRVEPPGISGHLERKKLPVTLEYLQEKFGGGSYRLNLLDSRNSRSVIRAGRTIHVSGNPRPDVDILEKMSTGERVKTIREMGKRLRKWLPEAADFMESYEEK